MPVLIIATYNSDGTANAMNAAWGCIADTNRIAIYVSSTHKTMENIRARGAFTVSMADAAHAAACDYVGIASGNDVPAKLTKAGLHSTKSPRVDAPVIDELSMTLECTLVSYDEESELLIGEIVNVCADETILTDGKIDPEKLDPICFDPVHHTYRRMGEVVGKAFSDGLALK
jgi:flavin reductase (DIM6/NTAB) family NADH-FMN oxidoreductase RutF